MTIQILPEELEMAQYSVLYYDYMWELFRNTSPIIFEYIVEDLQKPITLQPGEEKILLGKEGGIPLKEIGKIEAMSISTTSKKLRVYIKVDDKIVTGSPEELLHAGLIGYNPTTVYLTVYDDESTPNVFSMWYTPPGGKPYYGAFLIKVINEDSEPATFSGSIYRYKVRKEFEEFFKKQR